MRNSVTSICPPPPRGMTFGLARKLRGANQLRGSLDRIPVFVRAGAILPLGPEIEYAAQHPEDPIELRVYRGSDGHFDLYDDEGDGYGYETKRNPSFPFMNDTERRLTMVREQAAIRECHNRFAFVSSLSDRITAQGRGFLSDRQDVTYSGTSIQLRTIRRYSSSRSKGMISAV